MHQVLEAVDKRKMVQGGDRDFWFMCQKLRPDNVRRFWIVKNFDLSVWSLHRERGDDDIEKLLMVKQGDRDVWFNCQKLRPDDVERLWMVKHGDQNTRPSGLMVRGKTR